MTLKDKTKVIVPLEKRGNNVFTVDVFDDFGRNVPLEENIITITYTLATVSAILASHSIGVEVRENSRDSKSTLDYLVREGDTLPAKGTKTFRAAETIRPGDTKALNFKLWEGEIEDDVEDNRFIGYMKITGDDFSFGMIPAGAEINCNYVVNDSGSINLELDIPSIGQSFNNDKNFYSRQEGQVDLDHAAVMINREGKKMLGKIKDLAGQMEFKDNEELQKLGEIASKAINIRQDSSDREELQHISDDILHAKKILNKIRRENLSEIRQKELKHLIEYYQQKMIKYSDEDDQNEYNKLFESAKQAIRNNNSEFEDILAQVRYLNYRVNMENNPEFPIQWFIWKIENPENYSNENAFYQLVTAGKRAIENNDIQTLKQILNELARIEIRDSDEGMEMMTNITRG